MATINHKTYNEATETFKDFNVYDGKETLIFKVDGSEGNVGIGTTDPQTILNDFSTSARGLAISNSYPLLGFSDTDGGKFFIGTQANIGYIWNNGTSDIVVATNAAERMRITSTGNVGIGISSPADLLEIGGNIRANVGNGLGFMLTGSSASGLVRNNGSGIALRTNTTDRLVIDSSGNVGIGTTSPSYTLEVSGAAQVRDYFRVTNTAGAQRILLGNQDSSGANNPSIIFSANGNLSIGNGDSWSGNGGTVTPRITVTSDGLTFNGDTAAANALDDYEEGTWTPILRGAATAGTYETLDPVAKYTKIGNQVNLNMRMELAASVTGGGTGYAIISNLPFTKSSDQQAVGSVVFSNVTFSAGTIQVLTEFQTSAASSNIYFPQVISGSGITDLPISAFTGSEVIRLSITYFV